MCDHHFSQVRAAGQTFEEYGVLFIDVFVNLYQCMCYVLSVH